MVIGGNHDLDVPNISDEEINHATEADDPEVIAHVAKFNEEEAAKAKVAAEAAAKHAAENPGEIPA